MFEQVIQLGMEKISSHLEVLAITTLAVYVHDQITII